MLNVTVSSSFDGNEAERQVIGLYLKKLRATFRKAGLKDVEVSAKKSAKSKWVFSLKGPADQIEKAQKIMAKG